MKIKTFARDSWIAALFILFSFVISNRAAEGFAGHWEGTITLPGTELEIRVDFERTNDAWSGTIDIPVQGLRGFKLGVPESQGKAVSFSMPNIPGNPKFSGILADSGQAIAGNFQQSGQSFAFHLERKNQRMAREGGETPSKGLPGTGFAGIWQGSLRVSVMELRLLVKLQKSETGELTGTMDSLDQNAKGLPISKARENGKTLEFNIAAIGGAYKGGLSADGSEIAGDWTQGGQTMPLVLKRLEKAPDLSRPQEPKKPLPYAEQDVAFTNADAGISLGGTLTIPKSDGPHPAVVLITGSGPQDRDEAIMGHRPFLVLADHLTRQGIAVLRFDDRGVGKSGGVFAKATNSDFVTDALSAVAYLKTHPEIDSRRIGLVGHSEGGITAPRAAARSEDVAFMGLLAGVGVPMQDLLYQQGKDIARVMGADEEALAKQASLQRRIFSIALEMGANADAEESIRKLFKDSTAELTPKQKKTLGISDAFIDSQVKVVLTPWFREMLAYDPRPTLEKVKCPVLAINGEKDLQVAAKPNLEAIKDALHKGGNADIKTVELPELNHMFQKCKTGAISEYSQIEETFNPVALTLISDWIREKTGL